MHSCNSNSETNIQNILCYDGNFFLTANIVPYSPFTFLQSHLVYGSCHGFVLISTCKKVWQYWTGKQWANFAWVGHRYCTLSAIPWIVTFQRFEGFCVAGYDKWKCVVSDNEWALQPIHSSKCNCNMNTHGSYSPSDNIYIPIKHLDGLAILCSYVPPISGLQVRIGINNLVSNVFVKC